MKQSTSTAKSARRSRRMRNHDESGGILAVLAEANNATTKESRPSSIPVKKTKNKPGVMPQTILFSPERISSRKKDSGEEDNDVMSEITTDFGTPIQTKMFEKTVLSPTFSTSSEEESDEESYSNREDIIEGEKEEAEDDTSEEEEADEEQEADDNSSTSGDGSTLKVDSWKGRDNATVGDAEPYDSDEEANYDNDEEYNPDAEETEEEPDDDDDESEEFELDDDDIRITQKQNAGDKIMSSSSEQKKVKENLDQPRENAQTTTEKADEGDLLEDCSPLDMKSESGRSMDKSSKPIEDISVSDESDDENEEIVVAEIVDDSEGEDENVIEVEADDVEPDDGCADTTVEEEEDDDDDESLKEDSQQADQISGFESMLNSLTIEKIEGLTSEPIQCQDQVGSILGALENVRNGRPELHSESTEFTPTEPIESPASQSPSPGNFVKSLVQCEASAEPILESCNDDAPLETPTAPMNAQEENSAGNTKGSETQGETIKETLSYERSSTMGNRPESTMEREKACKHLPENDQDKVFFKRTRSEGMIKQGQWTLGSRIGTGSFGVVHVGMNHRNGSLMAVKSIHMQPQIMTDIRREIDLLRSLQHVNIVRYYGAEINGSDLHIFQEWVAGGSVSDLLSKFGPFPFPVIQSYAEQMLNGLSFLHSNSILHRDIKGSNLLVTNSGIVKLADFGGSKRFTEFHSDMMMSMTMRGTPYFMALEVFEQKYSAKADVWSVGCVLYQMVTATVPWKSLGFNNPFSLCRHLQVTDGPPALPRTLPATDVHVLNHFLKLLASCFHRNPYDRPAVSNLLQDPFFMEKEYFSDDEYSESTGLFSPDVIRTRAARLSSPLMSKPNNGKFDSSPARRAAFKAQTPPRPRRNSIGAASSPFMSPPLPKRADTQSASPQYASPAKDTSEWPEWAKQRYQETMPGNGQDAMFDSLAYSSESIAQTSDDTMRGSAGQSLLNGLEFLSLTSGKPPRKSEE